MGGHRRGRDGSQPGHSNNVEQTAANSEHTARTLSDRAGILFFIHYCILDFHTISSVYI